jgi:hypothetical protein
LAHDLIRKPLTLFGIMRLRQSRSPILARAFMADEVNAAALHDKAQVKAAKPRGDRRRRQ